MVFRSHGMFIADVRIVKSSQIRCVQGDNYPWNASHPWPICKDSIPKNS